MKTGQALSFESLQAECAQYERKGWVLLCGDFNARTNDVNDFIENDELDDYLPMDDNYVPDQHKASEIAGVVLINPAIHNSIARSLTKVNKSSSVSINGIGVFTYSFI